MIKCLWKLSCTAIWITSIHQTNGSDAVLKWFMSFISAYDFLVCCLFPKSPPNITVKCK